MVTFICFLTEHYKAYMKKLNICLIVPLGHLIIYLFLFIIYFYNKGSLVCGRKGSMSAIFTKVLFCNRKPG